MGRLHHKFIRAFVVGVTVASVLQADAATHYVSPAGGQVSPFSTWATAARVIQDAVDAAIDGDDVLVTNGTYATGGRAAGTNSSINRVAVDKIVALHSVNGPQFTVIDGLKAVRCVSLASNASLTGFTLTNGVISDGGGGVYADWSSAIVSNCTITASAATNIFSGFGGGAYGPTLYN